MSVEIFHNPRCSKSRQTLELLENNECSETQPLQCNEGYLYPKAQECGCSEGYVPSGNECIEE